MKILIKKLAYFVLPFFLIYFLGMYFYREDKGDLLRLGYIADIYGYDFKLIFRNELFRKKNYTLFSELDLKKENKFTTLVIGDSFSEQGSYGYKNYLADSNDLSVLHFDRFSNANPLELLSNILNGDVLDHIQIKYVVLQSIEREMVKRGLELNKNGQLKTDSLIRLFKANHEKKKENESEKETVTFKDHFFSRKTLKIPLRTFFYLVDEDAFSSAVYQVNTKRPLFSTSFKKLLFLSDDYNYLQINNNLANVNKLNIELNMLAKKLAKRGIKLIVLPCPDKFDFYYDEIITKNNYTKPLFFEHMGIMKKEYMYLDAKKILTEKAKNVKDVYLFDDTHWSPIASKIIAEELRSSMVIQ
jgi:hypothetical protein